MTREKKQTTEKKSNKVITTGRNSFDLLPDKYQTPFFLAVILILLLFFFRDGVFGGKVFSSSDNLASASFNVFLEDAEKQGIFAQWMPYIFCGMPSFAALIPFQERTYDIAYAIYMYIRNVIYYIGGNTTVWHVLFFYIVFAYGVYFYARYRFSDKLIAFYCSLAAVFMTPIIQLIIVGHNSKMIAIMSFPYVLLLVDKIYDYFSDNHGKKPLYRILLLFCALVFTLHVQMSSNHIQMLYYFFLASGFYMVYRVLYSIIKKSNVRASVSTLAIFIVSVVISALMYSDSYLSIREYNKHSIRGQPSVLAQGTESGDKKQPLDYEYATNWSFSPLEVMTFFVPYWVGFGDVEHKGQRTNTYWGQMPFTTSPMYFGIITLLLGFIGIYYNFRRNVIVQVLVLVSLISLFISFGRTLPLLYDIFYYHAPFFSSFRAPVMIHILINISFAILAGFGIKSVTEVAQDKISAGKFISTGRYIFPLLALPVIISIIGFESYYTSQVKSGPLYDKIIQQGITPQQAQMYLKQVADIAYSNVKSEMFVIGLLLILSYSLCYFYVKGRIKYTMLGTGLVLLMIFDLWHIDLKTLHWDNKTEMETYFKTPDWVDWLLKNDPETYNYRILHLQGMTPVRENTTAYWRLHNVYGYQGAKMRIYQDFDDVVGIYNPTAWDITNVKYIISSDPVSDSLLIPVFRGSKNIYRNALHQPRAYFVKEVKQLSGLEILNKIKSGEANLKETAFIEKSLSNPIEPADTNAKADITSYGIHNITIDAEASGNNFLFISEVFYPEGWKAFIDGTETEIYKTNYLYRGIIVPPGKHRIEFKYESPAYENGRKICVGTNIFMLAIFVVGMALFLKNRKSVMGNSTVRAD